MRAMNGVAAAPLGDCVLQRQASRKNWDEFRGGEEWALIEQYERAGNFIVGPWRDCLDACRSWTEGMHLPLAARLVNAALPRVTYDALVAAMDASSETLVVELEDPERGGAEQGRKPSASDLLAWYANEAHVRFSGGDVKDLQRWAKRSNKMTWLKRYENAFFDSIFEDKDASPCRGDFFKFGKIDAEDDWNPATFQILLRTPALVERNGRVHFAVIVNVTAKLLHDKELQHRLLRSHAAIRYSNNMSLFFSEDGQILDQNPGSLPYFGMGCVALRGAEVSDDGKPVNRLKSLFGDTFDAVMAALETSNSWSGRIDVSWAQLKPWRTNIRSSMNDFSDDDDEEECDFVLKVTLNRVHDPATGHWCFHASIADLSKRARVERRMEEMRKQKQELLSQILPPHIVDGLLAAKKSEKGILSSRSSSTSSELSRAAPISQLSSSGELDFSEICDCESRVRSMAEYHEQVTVFFADIVGFTAISQSLTAPEVMIMLNDLFTRLDTATDDWCIYKVETIGDAYMCAAGLNLKGAIKKGDCDGQAARASGRKACLYMCAAGLNLKGAIKKGDCDGQACPRFWAQRMLGFAREAVEMCGEVLVPRQNTPVQIRIGVHTGDVTTGVVGHKMPRFCLFGDTVNVASRMESTGKAGHIQASEATRDLLPQEDWVATGGVEVKGKGTMETFLLSAKKTVAAE
eukprot:CAMPEP_0197498990 /NCGR_PEP_ID=MMETSP1311-20131121/60796_1 /TAXON_ID=464262 /ORGANISM="Genus nov. species nov., Strain RCC856" /LENGTH=689 /DNA_ID=CAMNT_0043044729 /DNA_START=72 /DNA_END=2142 /DNA_ORIENTATION=+